MIEVENISVFDLDGTLWKKNSHIFMLNIYFHTHFYTGLLARIFSRLFPEFWQKTIDRKFAEIPQSFVSDFDLSNFGIDASIKNILEKKKKNSTVVIVSNAPERIVQKASSFFGIEGFHAQAGKKLNVLQKHYKYKNMFVCTDNKTDSDLLESADEKLFIKKEMSAFEFFIPLVYSFKTRYKGLSGIGSFFVTSVLPTVVYFHIFVFNGSAIKNFASLFLSWFIINVIYEVGYIINDVYSVNNEAEPTQRLTKHELKFCKTKMLSVMNCRLFVVTVSYVLLVILELPLYLLSLACLFLMMFYLMHNSLSEKYRYISNFGLVALRFTAPFFIFPVEKNLIPILALFITLPCLKTLTYFLKKNCSKSESFLDNFQVFYFALVTLILFVSLSFVSVRNFFLCPAYSVFLLFYRIGVKVFRMSACSAEGGSWQ